VILKTIKAYRVSVGKPERTILHRRLAYRREYTIKTTTTATGRELGAEFVRFTIQWIDGYL
jgi:hypothetical protein